MGYFCIPSRRATLLLLLPVAKVRIHLSQDIVKSARRTPMAKAPPKSDNATHGHGSREWSRPCPRSPMAQICEGRSGEFRCGYALVVGWIVNAGMPLDARYRADKKANRLSDGDDGILALAWNYCFFGCDDRIPSAAFNLLRPRARAAPLPRARRNSMPHALQDQHSASAY